jgi:hypothetical protein
LQVLLTKIAESYNPASGRGRKTKAADDSIGYRLKMAFFTPALAPVLRNRWLNCFFVAFGVAQLLLVSTGLSGWRCPIYETLGVICPGCGMTTAAAMLVNGHWQSAFQTHVFAPVIVPVLITMLVAIGLPTRYLIMLSGRIERLEQKSGMTAILLLSMIGYWLLRIFQFI